MALSVVKFNIPVFDTQVDTSDPEESISNLFGAAAGGIAAMSLIGLAKYGYGRITNAAGVDNNLDLGEGV